MKEFYSLKVEFSILNQILEYDLTNAPKKIAINPKRPPTNPKASSNDLNLILICDSFSQSLENCLIKST